MSAKLVDFLELVEAYRERHHHEQPCLLEQTLLMQLDVWRRACMRADDLLEASGGDWRRYLAMQLDDKP